MKQTTNMKLNKPEYSDVVDIEKLNENFDKIDSKIAEVSGQTVVDSAMSESSSNPVQNKVVKQYIDSKAFNGGSGSVTVDASMSDTSTNPVQNKIVKAYVDSKTAAAGDAGYYDIKATATSGGQGTSIEGFSCTTISTGTLEGAISDGKTLRVVISIDTKKIILPLVYYRKSTLSSNPFYATFSGMDKTSDGVYLYTVIFDSENGVHGTWTAHSTKVSDIIIDESLSGTSTNSVQNKAVKTALDAKAGTAIATQSANGLMSAADKQKLDGIDGNWNITVDAALDAASENPVQNKAVKAALDGKLSARGGDVAGSLTLTGGLTVGRTDDYPGVHLYKDSVGVAKMTSGSADADDNITLARLKVAAPAEDDDAATKAYVDNNAAGAGAVRYDAAQTLDEAQQFQARKNIGAVGHDSPQFAGYLTLAPANETLGIGVGLSPSRDGNNFALDISDVNEGTPTLLTGVKTPTDADTNAAATVEYVLGKALPSVTAADNGKILKVVNGAWQAVSPD